MKKKPVEALGLLAILGPPAMSGRKKTEPSADGPLITKSTTAPKRRRWHALPRARREKTLVPAKSRRCLHLRALDSLGALRRPLFPSRSPVDLALYSRLANLTPSIINYIHVRTLPHLAGPWVN
jgi:hypothetical protein